MRHIRLPWRVRKRYEVRCSLNVEFTGRRNFAAEAAADFDWIRFNLSSDPYRFDSGVKDSTRLACSRLGVADRPRRRRHVTDLNIDNPAVIRSTWSLLREERDRENRFQISRGFHFYQMLRFRSHLAFSLGSSWWSLETTFVIGEFSLGSLDDRKTAFFARHAANSRDTRRGQTADRLLPVRPVRAPGVQVDVRTR